MNWLMFVIHWTSTEENKIGMNEIKVIAETHVIGDCVRADFVLHVCPIYTDKLKTA